MWRGVYVRSVRGGGVCKECVRYVCVRSVRGGVCV